jgi:hypothetical protein
VCGLQATRRSQLENHMRRLHPPVGRKSPKVVVSLLHLFSSVLDPYTFDTETDLDPAFWAEYQSRSKVLMTKNLKKFAVEKKIKFFLEQKTTIYLSLGPIMDV